MSICPERAEEVGVSENGQFSVVLVRFWAATMQWDSYVSRPFSGPPFSSHLKTNSWPRVSPIKILHNLITDNPDVCSGWINEWILLSGQESQVTQATIVASIFSP